MNENTELDVVETAEVCETVENTSNMTVVLKAVGVGLLTGALSYIGTKAAALAWDKIDDIRCARAAKKAAKEMEKRAMDGDTEHVDD